MHSQQYNSGTILVAIFGLLFAGAVAFVVLRWFLRNVSVL